VGIPIATLPAAPPAIGPRRPEPGGELSGADAGGVDCGADAVVGVAALIRCDDPEAPAATRALLLEMIDAGVTHIVLAAILSGRSVQWLADEIIEPVIAEVQRR
jgi:hypothetical protein